MAKIAIFIKILVSLNQLLSDFQFCLRGMNEVIVSINRIDKLLKSKDIDISRIRVDSVEERDVAILLENGEFYWSKKSIEDENINKKTDDTENGRDVETDNKASFTLYLEYHPLILFLPL